MFVLSSVKKIDSKLKFEPQRVPCGKTLSDPYFYLVALRRFIKSRGRTLLVC